MALRKQVFRGSALLAASEAVVYGSSFVRNMILARLLTKADFGVAATLSMVILLLEFSGKLGISQFVIRDKQSGHPATLGAAHLLLFCVAAVSSLLILAASPLLADLFGLYAELNAMLALALIPLLNGLQHLDIRRFERELRFGPTVFTEMIPQMVITLAAWPLALWLRDYRVMLVLLILKSLMTCLASHWIAEAPYRWRLDREQLGRMLQFGAPLLVSGFLMFGVMHGDQFLVAAFYSMGDLGPYAAAAAITVAPTYFFGRVFNTIMLPLVSRVQDDPVALRRRYGQALAVISAFSVASSVGMILGAEAIMRVVYGPQYVGAGVFLALLAIANAFRNLRIAPALAAIARGDSKNQMLSNLFRVSALLPALVIASTGQPVWMIAGTGLVGEALACWVSFARLRRRDGVPLRISLVPAAWLTLLITGAGVAGFAGCHTWPIHWALPVAVLGALLGGGLLVLVLPELRQETARFHRQLRTGGWRQLLRGAASKPAVS